MKYYSEDLQKLFDTQEALVKAEDEAKRKQESRETRAKEVQAAEKKAKEAVAEYSRLYNAFIKDYGSFHVTRKSFWESPFDVLFNF